MSWWQLHTTKEVSIRERSGNGIWVAARQWPVREGPGARARLTPVIEEGDSWAYAENSLFDSRQPLRLAWRNLWR